MLPLVTKWPQLLPKSSTKTSLTGTSEWLKSTEQIALPLSEVWTPPPLREPNSPPSKLYPLKSPLQYCPPPPPPPMIPMKTCWCDVDVTGVEVDADVGLDIVVAVGLDVDVAVVDAVMYWSWWWWWCPRGAPIKVPVDSVHSDYVSAKSKYTWTM